MECTNEFTMKKLTQEYIKENWSLFIVYVLFVLIYPLQDVGLPHLFGKITKSIQSGESLTLPLVYIIIIIFVLQIGYSLGDYVEVRMFPSVQKFVREKMISHIFEIQKTNFEEIKVGEVTTKLIKMPPLMYAYMEYWKNLFIPQTVVFAVAIIYFLYHNWLIGITLFILVIALALTVYNSVYVCEKLAKRRDYIYNVLHEEVDDVLRNMVTVLNYSQEDAEIARMDIYHNEYSALSEESLNCALRVRHTFVPIILCYLIFFTYFSYRQVLSGTMDTGTFISIFIIMIYIINSMWKIIGSVKDIVLRWGMIQETLELFKVCKRTNNGQIDIETIPQLPGIMFYNVSYEFANTDVGGSRKLFSNLNLHFKPYERVLIVGQIGSGKTTILKLIMKYIEPTNGEIFFNNIPYHTIQAGDLRKFIGYVPQNPILFNRTIYENVTYGMPEVSKNQVDELVRQLGLEDVFSRMPRGLDTNVGKYGSKISGGQRQIVWILRTIIQNPLIVLMDEPTSSIDENTKAIVHKLLEVIMKDKTVIMVTHDPYLIQFSDRIVELKHGEIVSDKYTRSEQK